MPYRTPVRNRDGTWMTYDSGDYPATLALALEAAQYRSFRDRQAALRSRGRHIGIGVGNYVEGTGRGPFESARIRVHPSGRVTVATGATAQGQGLKTALAQICAAALGLDPGAVDVTAGDTDSVSLGLGAFASRQAVTAGSSAHIAASALADKAIRVAAHMLEAAPEDLELAGGRVRLRGVADVSVALGDIARALAGQPGYALPGGTEPGMEALGTFVPDTLTYCNGCHVAEVEVDIETGAVDILRYTAVHDCGRMINPMIVEGQVVGGAVHGIGSALYERMVFDDAGQPMTVNLGEYVMPGACEAPRIGLRHTESPTPLNPLGAKGAGEGGTIPAPAAIAAAVEDALAPFGILIDDVPIAPDRIVAAVAAARR